MGNEFPLIWIEPTVHTKAKTISKGREKPLTVISRWDNHSPSDTATCLSSFESWTLRGAAWAQSSLSARSGALCFTPSLHTCVAFSGANRTLRTAPYILPCWLVVSLVHPSICRSILWNVFTCLRNLKASAGSSCGRKALAGLPLQSICTSALLRLGTWH